MPYVNLVNEILESYVYYVGIGPSVTGVTNPGGATLILPNPAQSNFPDSGNIVEINSQPLTPPIAYSLASDNVTLSLQSSLPGSLILSGQFTIVVSGLPSESNNTPSDASTNDLAVNPEYTVQQVYDPTSGPLSTAVYPFRLPFNRFLETARVYFKNLHTSLHEVMRTFAANDNPSDLAIACESLSISPEERAIIDGSAWGGAHSGRSLGDFYGYPGVSEAIMITPTSPVTTTPVPPGYLGLVENFLNATGLAYCDLVNLLETQFINPDQRITLYTPATVTNTTVNPNVPVEVDPCDLTYTTFQGLYKTTDTSTGVLQVTTDISIGFLQRVHCFLRLWKKTGWTMTELDKALTAFGVVNSIGAPNSGEISDQVLQDIAELKWLETTLSLSVTQVLSLFSNIDADGRDSLYISLFQNKAVINPLDPSFGLTYFASLPPTPASAATAPQGAWPGLLPETWSDGTSVAQAVYDPANAVLRFTGTMTDDEQTDLLTWAGNNDSVVLAVENLFNQRWMTGTDIIASSGQSQPLISSHLNTILAALQVSAADLAAIAADCGFIPPSADVSGCAWAVLSGTVTVGDSVMIAIGFPPLGNLHLPVGVPHRYAAVLGDTLDSIAAAITALIKSDTSLQARGVSATAQGNLINVYAVSGVSITWGISAAGSSIDSRATESMSVFMGQPLDHTSLSALYRYAALAQALNLSVSDLISLKNISGINPFATAATAPVTSPLAQFVKAAQMVQTSNFSVAQLDYVYRALPDPADSLPPQDAVEQQLLAGLSAGLQKIAAADVFTPDPKGTALRKNLAAILPPDQLAPTMDLIGGSAVYSTPLVGLPLDLTRQAPQAPALTTLVTIGGATTQNDSVNLTLTLSSLAASPVILTQVVNSTDTPSLIAQNLLTQITQNSTLKDAGITAQQSGAVIAISTPLTLNPLQAWTATITPAPTSATEHPVVSGIGSSSPTLTIGGSATPQDVVAVTFAGLPNSAKVTLTYSVGASDSSTSIATNLCNLINGNQTLGAAGISATSPGSNTGNVVTLSVPAMLSSSLVLTPGAAPAPTWATETVTVVDAALDQVAYITTVTIGGSATVGDTVTLSLILGGVAEPVTLSCSVDEGDTSSSIAAALAGQINNNTTMSAAGISATAAAAVISISSELLINPRPVLDVGARVATEIVTVTGNTVTLSGSATPGDIVTLVFSVSGSASGFPVTLPYTVSPADNLGTIATNLCSLITSDTALMATYIATAVPNGNAISLTLAASQNPPIVITPTTTPPSAPSGSAPPAASEQIMLGSSALSNALTLGGSVTPGDTVTLTLFGNGGQSVTLPYTVKSDDTLGSIAAALQQQVTNNLLNNAGITAVVDPENDNAIIVTSPSSLTPPVVIAASMAPPPATESVTIAGSAGNYTATIGGSPTPRDVVTLTFPETGGSAAGPPLSVSYPVAANDMLSSIATGLINLITGSQALQTAGITAVPGGATTILITAPATSSAPIPTYTPALSAASETITSNGAPALAITGSPTQGDVVSLSVSLGAGTGAALFLTCAVATGETLAGIASDFANQVASNAALIAAGITATATGSVLILTSAPSLSPSQAWNVVPPNSTATVTETVTIAGSALACTGPMSDATQDNLLALAVSDASDSQFIAAVTSLYNEAQDVLSGLYFLAPPTLFKTPLSSLPANVSLPSVPPGQVLFISTLTVGGTVTPGDQLTLTTMISGSSVSVTIPPVANYDTPDSIAAKLAVQINSNSTLSQQSISASVSGSVIMFSAPASGSFPVWTITTSADATEIVASFTGLVCYSPMTNSTRMQLEAVTTDSNFVAAVEDLYSQAWGAASQMLIDAPSSEVLADRYNYVLQSLLNSLQTTQSQSLVKQTLSQALELNAALVALLLQGDPTNVTAALLPSQSLTAPSASTQPAMADFLGGLLAFYCSDSQLETVVKSQIDPGVNLDGTEPAFGSAQWFGQVAPPTTDSYTFSVAISVGPLAAQLWVNGQLLIDQINDTVLIPRISLQAGQLYDIQLNVLATSAGTAVPPPSQPQIELQWSNSSVSQQTIPPAAFILGAAPASAQGVNPSNATTLIQGGAYATLSVLNRIAVLVNGFSMKTSEVEYFSDHATDFAGTDPSGSNTAPFDLSVLPMVDVSTPQPAIDGKAPALFDQWQRLFKLYKLKAGLPTGGNVGLFDIFQAAVDSNSGTALTISQTVLQATGWSATELSILTGSQMDPTYKTPIGFALVDRQFKNEMNLVQLAACVALGNRLGASSKQLFVWANNEPDATLAQQIQNTIKAKYSESAWLQVGASLNNKIRAGSKDALIAYILSMQQMAANNVSNVRRFVRVLPH